MIDIFNKQQFESALPKNLWSYQGLSEGEHTYRMSVTEDIFIIIRSSVKSNGWSADTGQDSIRAWLVGEDNKPLGSKVSEWVTRLPGWQDRLIVTLRTLWKMGKKANHCSKCHSVRGVFKVKKEGPNKGKLFAKCTKCGSDFQWLED